MSYFAEKITQKNSKTKVWNNFWRWIFIQKRTILLQLEIHNTTWSSSIKCLHRSKKTSSLTRIPLAWGTFSINRYSHKPQSRFPRSKSSIDVSCQMILKTNKRSLPGSLRSLERHWSIWGYKLSMERNKGCQCYLIKRMARALLNLEAKNYVNMLIRRRVVCILFLN